MKILLILFPFFLPLTVLSQDTTAASETFVVLYTTGAGWDASRQFHEQPYFSQHSEHLSNLRKTKRILLGGRYSDTGMILLKAKDMAEAKELITTDPAIQKKLFNAEIFSFDAFYKGCVD